MNEDGHTSSIRDKILTINVKRGWRSGTRITFQKEGDQVCSLGTSYSTLDFCISLLQIGALFTLIS